jgi:hypothetical protein
MGMRSEREVVKMLPTHGFLREYVRWAAARTDAHIAFHVPVALELLSQSVPLDFNFPFGSEIRANFYSLLVGSSRKSHKTTSIKLGRSVLLKAMSHQLMEQPGSWEVLIDSLRGDSNSQQLLIYPEFGAFLSESEKGYLAPLRTKLVELYDALPISRALKKNGGKKSLVERPRLSVLGGCAPGFLEEHTSSVDWTEGFFARFYIISAERERTMELPSIDDEERDRLAALLLEYRKTQGENGTMMAPCLGFSKEAGELWVEWQQQLEILDSRQLQIAAALAGVHDHAMKMAALLEWDIGRGRSDTAWYVGPEAVQIALNFAQLHIDSVFEIAKNFAGDRDMQIRRRILAAIKETPTSLGDILLTSKVIKKRAREFIETLIEEGLVEPVSSDDPEEHGIRFKRTTI